MFDVKTIWKERVVNVLNTLLKENGINETLNINDVIVEKPPKPEMGDIAFPMFPFAKIFKKAPPQIAAAAASSLDASKFDASSLDDASPFGPYLNVRLDRGSVSASILDAVFDKNKDFCKSDKLKGRRVMVEFSSPNTNKPLHLGH
ncbi:MAG: arginine--tRNA ligase, partial [Spirochaetaceae bacterium]|nr:arginine--tRNA ligase [Spirochaetaceae bacterium]